jgi:hypothetical protein
MRVRNIFICSGVVFCASSRMMKAWLSVRPRMKRERCDLDAAALEQLGDALETHQVVERVVQRAQVGIDLLRQIPRQEAEPLARLDRRSGQDDTLDQFAFERIDSAGHREIGLAGSGRPDAEGDVMRLDIGEVLDLARRAPVQLGLARQQAGAA